MTSSSHALWILHDDAAASRLGLFPMLDRAKALALTSCLRASASIDYLCATVGAAKGDGRALFNTICAHMGARGMRTLDMTPINDELGELGMCADVQRRIHALHQGADRVCPRDSGADISAVGDVKSRRPSTRVAYIAQTFAHKKSARTAALQEKYTHKVSSNHVWPR